MQDETKNLALHVRNGFSNMAGLQQVLNAFVLELRALRLTLLPSEELKQAFQDNLNSPLDQKQQEALSQPLQTLRLAIALVEHQFGPFEEKPPKAN
ncbi:MAG: hypothetical protein LAN36_06535 [Acidobacteriia bacterium]|nr:hypothetical protein [Terriglobia bacterium]